MKADEARLRQVLINLVGNALKFTDEGSVRVLLEVDAHTGKPTAISVKDTGVGIANEGLEEIFHAFEQEDGTIRRRHPGSGLGLAISRSLCGLMGFGLTVESEPGEGSTFSVRFSSGNPPPQVSSPTKP